MIKVCVAKFTDDKGATTFISGVCIIVALHVACIVVATYVFLVQVCYIK